MNSRERVRAAIRHQEPGRVPVDLGATPSSGISAIVYGNLQRHLGIQAGHNRVYGAVQLDPLHPRADGESGAAGWKRNFLSVV